MTTVLVADDDPVVRAGIAALLSEEADLVVRTGPAGPAAVVQARRHDPDVVLLAMDPGGPAAIRQLPPSAVVVVLAHHEHPAAVRSAIDAGAAGYLRHGALDRRVLADAVRDAASGGAPLSAGAARVLLGLVRTTTLRPARVELAAPDPVAATGLTTREAEVMTCVAQGMANAAIAEELYVSLKTVKNHLNRAYAKLGASDRHDAARRWQAARDGARAA